MNDFRIGDHVRFKNTDFRYVVTSVDSESETIEVKVATRKGGPRYSFTMDQITKENV